MGFAEDATVKLAASMTGAGGKAAASSSNNVIKIVFICLWLLVAAFLGFGGIFMSSISFAEIVGIIPPLTSLGDSWAWLFGGIGPILCSYFLIASFLGFLMNRRWSAERRFRIVKLPLELSLSYFTLMLIPATVIVIVEMWREGVLWGILWTVLGPSSLIFWTVFYIRIMREFRRPFDDIMAKASAQKIPVEASAAQESAKANQKAFPRWHEIAAVWIVIMFVLVFAAGFVYLAAYTLKQLLGIVPYSPTEPLVYRGYTFLLA